MKQKCILLLVLLATVTLSACGVNINHSESTASLPTQEQQTISQDLDSPTQTEEGLDDITQETEDNRMKIQIGEVVLTAILVENSSTEALNEMLKEGPVTINMRDYGNMEKVGSFGTQLPRNDEQITTQAGDLILYQGNAFVIYYAPNSWNFTRLGKIDDVTPEILKEVLGDGDVTVTLSLD